MLENFEQVLIGATIPPESTRCSWKWTDQTAWNYTNWGPGQPNEDINEQCVTIWRDRQSKWNDVRCSDAKPFVCKKAAVRTGSGIQKGSLRKTLSQQNLKIHMTGASTNSLGIFWAGVRFKNFFATNLHRLITSIFKL